MHRTVVALGVAIAATACGTAAGVDAGADRFDAGRDAATEPVAPRDGGWPDHPLLTWGGLNIAHRGGAGERPEHTLEAYAHALEVGADVLELDLHRTADGALVVMHDATVDDTTDGTGAIAEMTLAEVRALDAGYRFGAADGFPHRGAGHGVPTLEEVFTTYPDASYLIEAKADDARLDRAMIDAIRAHAITSRVAIAAVPDAPLERARALEPSIPTALSASELVSLSLLSPTQELRYTPPAPLAAPPLGSVDAELVARLRRLGLFLHVWTVNEEADMERAIDVGATAIITDYPTRLAAVFERRGL